MGSLGHLPAPHFVRGGLIRFAAQILFPERQPWSQEYPKGMPVACDHGQVLLRKPRASPGLLRCKIKRLACSLNGLD